MQIEPATRRANFWLFVGLVVFAVALCALILLWMRARTHEQGGKVYPPVGVFLFCHPEWRPQAAVEGPSGSRQTPSLAYRRSEGPSTPLRSAQDDRGIKFAG